MTLAIRPKAVSPGTPALFIDECVGGKFEFASYADFPVGLGRKADVGGYSPRASKKKYSVKEDKDESFDFHRQERNPDF